GRGGCLEFKLFVGLLLGGGLRGGPLVLLSGQVAVVLAVAVGVGFGIDTGVRFTVSGEEVVLGLGGVVAAVQVEVIPRGAAGDKGGGQFEARHELPQLGGVFRQLTDRLGGGLGTQGGLRGDVLNDIHRRRDLGGGGGLVARRGGDVLN